jgi:hypothetical protein
VVLQATADGVAATPVLDSYQRQVQVAAVAAVTLPQITLPQVAAAVSEFLVRVQTAQRELHLVRLAAAVQAVQTAKHATPLATEAHTEAARRAHTMAAVTGLVQGVQSGSFGGQIELSRQQTQETYNGTLHKNY